MRETRENQPSWTLTNLQHFMITIPKKNWLVFLKALAVCKLIPQYTMIFCLKSLGICELWICNFRGLDKSSRTSRSCHRHVLDFDTHLSVVEYSVAYFLFIFRSTRVCFGQVWSPKTITLRGDRKPFWICPSSWTYHPARLWTTPPPPYINTKTMAWLWVQRDKLVGEGGGGDTGNVFNSGKV